MTPNMYLGLGITLIRQGDFENAIQAFCKAITLNPTYYPAYNNLGLALKDTNRLREAEACFCRAIELSPTDAFAYNNLGLVLMDLDDFPKATACFRQAIELIPDSCAVYNNLGICLEEINNFTEAKAAYFQALMKNPHYPEAHYNLGTMLRVTKNFVQAEEHLCQAIKLRPNYLEAEGALANLYLLLGKFANGWEMYEKSRPKRYGYSQLENLHWQGENLQECNILLCWEYGFGDTIQFARYVGKVKRMALKTSLWVQEPLVRLLAAAYPDVNVYSGKYPQTEHYDYICSLLSLPTIFNSGNTSIPQPVPYVSSSHTIAATWDKALEEIDLRKSYRVGVVWAGHPKHLNNKKRSIPFEIFADLFSISQVIWVNLQVGFREKDLIGTTYPVINFSKELGDFMDTAELIEELDLVITVDSAVAHLAGTIGKKTWVLIPFDPDWRWQLDREDSPWYPTVKIFRQYKLGDWQEVIERVKQALQDEVRSVDNSEMLEF